MKPETEQKFKQAEQILKPQFDYIEEIEGINVEYLNQVLKDVFKEEKMVLSIVKN